MIGLKFSETVQSLTIANITSPVTVVSISEDSTLTLISPLTSIAGTVSIAFLTDAALNQLDDSDPFFGLSAVEYQDNNNDGTIDRILFTTNMNYDTGLTASTNIALTPETVVFIGSKVPVDATSFYFNVVAPAGNTNPAVTFAYTLGNANARIKRDSDKIELFPTGVVSVIDKARPVLLSHYFIDLATVVFTFSESFNFSESGVVFEDLDVISITESSPTLTVAFSPRNTGIAKFAACTTLFDPSGNVAYCNYQFLVPADVPREASPVPSSPPLVTPFSAIIVTYVIFGVFLLLSPWLK